MIVNVILLQQSLHSTDRSITTNNSQTKIKYVTCMQFIKSESIEQKNSRETIKDAVRSKV